MISSSRQGLTSDDPLPRAGAATPPNPATGGKVRFAPSPTGLLHIGNARPALINWLFARRMGAAFLLRVDDTDAQRSRPEYEAAIAQDLAWLGLDWDETFRQSDRLERYEAAADVLRQSGRLYPCFETEDELRFKREQRVRRGAPPIYDRGMLKLTAEQRAMAEANGKRPYWRFKLSDKTLAWDDLVLGRREVKLPTLSDPVLIRADGTPLYTFTSVVDDIESGVTRIIRGEDHVTNTGVQLDLTRALGANPSTLAFAHLPLLLDEHGDKLSKRIGSVTLRSLRSDGVEPEAVTSYLARLGSSADPTPMPLGDLVADFDITRFSPSSPRFDIAQLMAMNRRVLHDAPFEQVAARLPEGATDAFWRAVRGNVDLLSETRGLWDVVAGVIVPPVIEGEQDFLRTALQTLPAEPWDEAVWTRWTDALKQATGRRGKALFMPLRLALTGEDHGPELRTLLPLMGRTRAATRLSVAAS